MATYQQLQNEVCGWLNRQDIIEVMPGLISMVETELAESLRARCMVVTAVQAIDSPYITLPAGFCTMESIRDHNTGELLVLKDEWSGSWTGYCANGGCTAYRLKADCIEFLPHPSIPDPPDPAWTPQVVEMGWYARPTPLLLPTDTNPVLEQLYGIYLYGCLAHAGVFERDPEMVSVWDAKYQQAVTRANLWKQQSDYSGAPFRAELETGF